MATGAAREQLPVLKQFSPRDSDCTAGRRVARRTPGGREETEQPGCRVAGRAPISLVSDLGLEHPGVHRAKRVSSSQEDAECEGWSKAVRKALSFPEGAAQRRGRQLLQGIGRRGDGCRPVAELVLWHHVTLPCSLRNDWLARLQTQARVVQFIATSWNQIRHRLAMQKMHFCVRGAESELDLPVPKHFFLRARVQAAAEPFL